MNTPLLHISLAGVSFIYGTFATLFCLLWPDIVGWRRFLVILSIIGLTIICSSIFGGASWALIAVYQHDWLLPWGQSLSSHILSTALQAMEIAPLLLLNAFPFNIIGLLTGYFGTLYGFKLARIVSEHRNGI